MLKKLSAFVLIGVFWGLNWPAVKFLLSEMPPLTIRAVSFTTAASTLFIVAIFFKQPLRLDKQDLVPTAVVGLLLIFGFNVLTTFGQLLVETSKAVLIAYTMPSITAILATVYLGEKLSKKLLLALLVAMLGLAVLASEDCTLLIKETIGPLIMIAAAISWALGNIGLKSIAWSIPPLSRTVWFFAISSIVIWPFVFIFEPITEQKLPSSEILSILTFHILGPMIFCYILWSILIANLPTTVAAISALVAPVVGVITSIVFLGDDVSWQKSAALSAIVFSIAITTLTSDTQNS